jgi:hypothetical protein
MKLFYLIGALKKFKKKIALFICEGIIYMLHVKLTYKLQTVNKEFGIFDTLLFSHFTRDFMQGSPYLLIYHMDGFQVLTFHAELVYVGWDFGDCHSDNFRVISDYNYS